MPLELQLIRNVAQAPQCLSQNILSPDERDATAGRVEGEKSEAVGAGKLVSYVAPARQR